MARAPKVTEPRVRDLIASGAGSGFGNGYRPLLQIKRWNPSPVSVQVTKPVPPNRRESAFFSHSEWYIALFLSWLGAFVREQFPCWSWPHFHPDYSRDPEVDGTLDHSVGMAEICRQMGIAHGYFPGTRIPYIWTIDICAHLPWVEKPLRRCVLISIKPLESERYIYIDPLDRGPEKLEGERRYANQIGAGYFVADRTLYRGQIFANLEFLAEAALIPTDHPLAGIRDQFLDAQGPSLQSMPLDEISSRLETDYKTSQHAATLLLNHMLWHQIIDCDLSKPIRQARPALPGGRMLRTALRNSLTRM